MDEDMKRRMERMADNTWNANCVHVYCRLCDLGLSKKWASRLARVYELADESNSLLKRRTKMGTFDDNKEIWINDLDDCEYLLEFVETAEGFEANISSGEDGFFPEDETKVIKAKTEKELSEKLQGEGFEYYLMK